MSRHNSAELRSALDTMAELRSVLDAMGERVFETGAVRLEDRDGGRVWMLEWDDRPRALMSRNVMVYHDAGSSTAQGLSLRGVRSTDRNRWVVLESDGHADQFEMVIFDSLEAAAGYYARCLLEVEVEPLMPRPYWNQILDEAPIALIPRDTPVLAEMILTGIYETVQIQSLLASRLRKNVDWLGAAIGAGHMKDYVSIAGESGVKGTPVFGRELAALEECCELFDGTGIRKLLWHGGVIDCKVCETSMIDQAQEFFRMDLPEGRPLRGPGSFKLWVAGAELEIYQRTVPGGVLSSACRSTNELGEFDSRTMNLVASADQNTGLLRCLQSFPVSVLEQYEKSLQSMAFGISRADQGGPVGSVMAAAIEDQTRRAVDIILTGNTEDMRTEMRAALGSLDATCPGWRSRLKEAVNLAFHVEVSPAPEWTQHQDMVQ
ncbi:hypothetical protein [Alcanivorax sp. 1008]|uniref:hypothetical protein n=1 Tax=Alcanivorax sp. 1008 TaxID=2816853 RepID=UPI001D65CCC8|nr:hypothetical protein [Alcanivorax sp. 1008]MCC1496759.1 hypothetical protein [Alcanivorax sp. 1008]